MLQGKTRPGEQDETNARGEKLKMQEITVMRKKNEGLQVMFNEALGRNTQLLNKKQAGGFTPKSCYARSKTNPPRLWKEKYRIMTILQWNTELEEEEQQLEKNCRDMQSKKWWPKTPIYKNCTTKSSAQILKCRRSNDRSDLRKTSSLYLKNCWWWQAIHENEQQRNKDMHEESKELQDKNDEKH